MTRIAPSTAANRYYLARMEAAKNNDRMNSREGASEETGIDRKRLQRIEIGTLEPYPEEIMLMADTYHAPELLNFYCTNACPIGRRTVPQAELQEIDRLTVKFLNALGNMRGLDEDLLLIAKDGKVSNDELPKLKSLVKAVKQMAGIAYEMQLFIDKQKGEE